jgi:hypothetical protein
LTSLWIASAAAAILPVLALLAGVLRWPRDFFLGLLYAQALAYLFVAPTVAAAALPTSTQTRYAFFLWWALPLFCAPCLLCYRWVLARYDRKWCHARRFRVRPVPSALFAAGTGVLAVGWLWVALTRNLLYRRLGAEGIASAQLDLSLLEFGLYRAFMEFAPFLAIFALVVLRVGRPASWVRALWQFCLLLTGALYGLNVLINSRLAGVLFLASLVGVFLITAPDVRRVRPERAILGLIALLAALYAVRVSENVRDRIASGGSAFDAANLNPAGKIGGGEEGYQLRLNGIDLVALIADNVEAQGPALGQAWAVPLLLQLDPLFRTDLTEQMKRSALTTSKSFLLLQYAGIAEPDYYSCMISDAYGNLGLTGFLLVAIVIAFVCAFATAGVRAAASPAVLLVASFVLSRVLPFEQEFANLLFGWVKLTPLLLLTLLVNPLVRAEASGSNPSAPLDASMVGEAGA